MKEMQNWWQLTAIQVGGAVCLPVIMIGQTLGQNYGMLSAILAIMVGNAILFALALLTVKMTCANRKPTMPNAEEYFGRQGIRFFAFAMIISLTGWFAIQINMMSLAVIDLFSFNADKEFWLIFLNLGLGLLITFCNLAGIKGIGLLANLALPCFLLTLGYGVFTVEPVVKTSSPLTFGGISLVIALAIACIVDLPTYYRFARTLKEARMSVFVKFAFILPALEICGVYISAGSAEGNILEIFKRENSAYWNVWVAMFLILAGWTTNNLNLYSGAISLQSVFTHFSEKKCTLLVGITGAFLSCFDLLKHFELTLVVAGIFISAMGSVVLTSYFMSEYFGWKHVQYDYSKSLMAWSLGIAIGFLSLSGYSLTSIALIDSFIGASLGVMMVLSYKGEYEKA